MLYHFQLRSHICPDTLQIICVLNNDFLQVFRGLLYLFDLFYKLMYLLILLLIYLEYFLPYFNREVFYLLLQRIQARFVGYDELIKFVVQFNNLTLHVLLVQSESIMRYTALLDLCLHEVFYRRELLIERLLLLVNPLIKLGLHLQFQIRYLFLLNVQVTLKLPYFANLNFMVLQVLLQLLAHLMRLLCII